MALRPTILLPHELHHSGDGDGDGDGDDDHDDHVRRPTHQDLITPPCDSVDDDYSPEGEGENHLVYRPSYQATGLLLPHELYHNAHVRRPRNQDFTPPPRDSDDERENHPVHYPSSYQAALLLPHEIYHYDDDAAGRRSHGLREFIFLSFQILDPTATQEELEHMTEEVLFILLGGREEDYGLSEEIIHQNLNSRKCQEKDLEEICVVCQCEYELEETVGRLQCGHEYHANCIKTWLLKNNSCPLCKREAIPRSSEDDRV